VNAVMLRQLIQMHLENKKPIVASAYAETLGVPALFDRSCFGDLLKLTGDSGAKGIILARRHDVAPFSFPAAAIDIDATTDYEKLNQTPSDT
jgi:molybdenum cofactor cytidylyltransferase